MPPYIEMWNVALLSTQLGCRQRFVVEQVEQRVWPHLLIDGQVRFLARHVEEILELLEVRPGIAVEDRADGALRGSPRPRGSDKVLEVADWSSRPAAGSG